MKIKINNRFFNFFNDISINYKLDSIASSFSFAGRFDPENNDHKAIFKPLSYNKVEIYNDDDTLQLTGVIVNTALGSNSGRELQVLSGYSKAGILEDCTIPYSSYPLENLNVNLEDLTKKMLTGFDISYIIDSTVTNEMKLVYEKTVAQPSETIKSFIAKLAAQRNIILSHNEKGNLVFFKPNLKAKPKLFLTEKNTLTMSLSVNGQSFHSEISVIRQPDKDNTTLSAVDTTENNLVLKYRPIVKVLSSGTETDTQKAASNALADELKNIAVTVTLNSIENVKCGDLIELQNEEIYIYNRSKFIISGINLTQNNAGEQMTLNLVLPETFSGENPKNIFL